MIHLLDWIAAAFVRGVNALFSVIPTWIILKTGRGAGFIVYLIGGSRKRIAYGNLRAAFSKQKSPHELKKTVRLLYMSLTESIMEMMCLTKVNAAYIKKYVKVENLDSLIRARDKGKGVILLTAHFGDWELSAITGPFVGFPLYVLARDQKMKRVNELLNRMRESKGSKVIRKGITTRLIVKALHEGHVIGMLADQNGGPNGMIADFFSRPVSNAYGPYRFAAKTGATIIPVFIRRVRGPYHVCTLEKPIAITDKEDLLPYIRRYNELLEKYVTEYTDQWLWFHRRWKYCPLKKIVILSDGKQGHLNQSLALAAAYRKYREVKGVKPEHTDVEIIEVRFRGLLRKAVFSVSSVFSGHACQGCMRCLKFALTEESYAKLERTYADVVISAGSSLAGVNSIFAIENSARNACAMKPGLLGAGKFSMCVLPRHDVKSRKTPKNVIVTDTVPNLADGDSIAAAAELACHVKRANPRAIGVLMGGDNDAFTYGDEAVSRVMGGVIDAAEKIGADILVTTSRRTKSKTEEIIRSRFAGSRACRLLVIANEDNPPYAVGGILGQSDVIVVSGESVSMVSEAVSSGKKVVVFKGDKVSPGLTRHDLFLENLKNKGSICVAGADNVSDVICRVSREPGKPDARGGQDPVYDNMWRLGA
ncbi:MAG: ELM1/GtrOC1 family putative glycosyltransferase [Candidatus Omnitrophota bacterium]